MYAQPLPHREQLVFVGRPLLVPPRRCHSWRSCGEWDYCHAGNARLHSRCRMQRFDLLDHCLRAATGQRFGVYPAMFVAIPEVTAGHGIRTPLDIVLIRRRGNAIDGEKLGCRCTRVIARAAERIVVLKAIMAVRSGFKSAEYHGRASNV